MDQYGWLIGTGIILVVGAVLCIVLLGLKRGLEATAQAVRDELRTGRKEAADAFRQLREEMGANAKTANENLSTTLKNMGELQQTQLGEFKKDLKDQKEAAERSLERVRGTMDERVKEMQESNEKKLEEMRQTVDEKLHDTLEKRLGESFKIVSDRLEAVHDGIGEMKSLAEGVGDLKRVLSNVKTRGTLSETQLGSILEEILAPQQYERNVETKSGSGQRVEYAVKLPGGGDDPDDRIWLPIDSKFPQEDYVRLQEASDAGDSDAVQRAVAGLARTIRREADTISEKYINPPETTDFAIMFVPTEGLYAEIVRQPDLLDELNKRRVFVAGPSTLAATLSGLRMGFQTLAISERATEVWHVLGAVKTEFEKFSGVLAKVKKQLGTATKTIEQTETRTRAMSRKLRGVAELPEAEATAVLSLPSIDDDGELSQPEDQLEEEA